MQVEVTHWPRCSQKGGWLLTHPSLHRHELAPFLEARARMVGWATGNSLDFYFRQRGSVEGAEMILL